MPNERLETNWAAPLCFGESIETIKVPDRSKGEQLDVPEPEAPHE
jgi:hypothetical protein